MIIYNHGVVRLVVEAKPVKDRDPSIFKTPSVQSGTQAVPHSVSTGLVSVDEFGEASW